MSMPSFPPNGADMTQEEALTMIIASIAMEELALSHILNAEGEKLQYILGTLPGGSPCTCPQDVLAVNKSVTALVEAVTQNQILLKNKLDHVLEFCPLPPLPPPPPACRPEPRPIPCPPPCQSGPCTFPCPAMGPQPCPTPRLSPYKMLPREKSAAQLTIQQKRTWWNSDCPLAWRLRSCTGKDICWSEHAPAQIQLKPGNTYALQYTLNVCAMPSAEETGSILLVQSPCGMFTDAPPLHISRLAHSSQCLHNVSILHPRQDGCNVALSLVLKSKTPLCVEQAIIDVVELC